MPQGTAIGSSMGPSTRRWQRYRVDVPIRVIVCHAMKASIFDGRGTSLSQGGMVLFAGAEFKPGDQVAVEFTPPFSSPPIRVNARICNRSGYHYGVEFTAVDHAQEQSIAQLRTHLATLPVVVEQ